MDQIKLLVKDVLHKIQDIPEIPFTSIRMSDIASEPSLSTPNSKSGSEHSVPKTQEAITPEKTHLSCQYNDVVTSTPHQVHQRDLLEATAKKLDSLYIRNLSTSRDSNLSLKSYTQSECPPKPKIIMGQRALLRSRSAETPNDDAAVVYDLVNQKYQDQISHYIGRMYHRRLSRESRTTEDDGTSSNYSTGSLRAPDSLYDDKTYFSLLCPQEKDLAFLRSTDDLNKETSAELNGTYSSVGQDTTIDFSPHEFLKTALGDVTLDSTFYYSFDTSSKLSALKKNMSSSNTSLFSKAGSLCNNIRKSFRRACSFKDRLDTSDCSTKSKTKNRDRCQSYSPGYNGSSENLMRELYVQNGIIFQVSKALEYCRSSKDLASPEYVEAEKILLVASCQKEALQAALNATEYDDCDLIQTYSAAMDISNLIFYVKADSADEHHPICDFDEYFVVIVSSGKTVLASKVLQADKVNGEVRPEKNFQLTGLSNDSVVCVAVYSIRVKHQVKGHEVTKARKACPSTKGLFHLSRHHCKSSRRNLRLDDVSTIKSSSFNLCGSCTLQCRDLQKSHFRMHHVPLASSLQGFFTCSLNGSVTLTNRTSDFLTIGFEDKNHLLWNRRWCVLDGSLLKYWNYPSEEFCCDPIGSIDMRMALEETADADRSICPRSRSLSLSIKHHKDDEVEVLRYFLAFDSAEEKQRWHEDINFVIGTLKAWNCLGVSSVKRTELVSSL